MRRLALVVLSLPAVIPCVAAPAVTNAVAGVASVAAATNAPVSKSTFAKAADDKQSRRQCEAITKSGTRCKRNSLPGGKLCRQHQKIKHRNP